VFALFADPDIMNVLQREHPEILAGIGVSMKQEAKLSLGLATVLPHSTFGVTWRHRSRDHLILLLVVLWNWVS